MDNFGKYIVLTKQEARQISQYLRQCSNTTRDEHLMKFCAKYADKIDDALNN